MPYIGKTPSQATRQRYYLTASGGETSVSGTMTVGGTLTFTDGEFVDVSVNGVALVAGTDYNTNTANTIAGLSALSANDQVEIVVYDTFSVFSGDIDSNLSVGGNLSVTGTITGGTLEATADTSAGDSAAIGFTSAEGLILTGQGSTSDITLKTMQMPRYFLCPLVRMTSYFLTTPKLFLVLGLTCRFITMATTVMSKMLVLAIWF